MQEWFHTLTKKLVAMPLILWVVIAALIAAYILLRVLGKDKMSKGVLIATLALLIGGLVFVILTSIPAFQAEDGSTSILYSPIFWASVVSIFGMLALLLLLRKQQWTTRMLATAALCVALSTILSYITLYRMPQGGSITPASMLPIMVFAWIYGPVPGMSAGVVYSVLKLMSGPYVVHPFQFLLDYILPFACLGIAGLFKGERQLPLAIIVATAVRFVIHVLSGVIYFASSAPAGQSPVVYSMVYNLSYMVPELILCLALVFIPRVSSALKRIKSEAESSMQ